MGGNISQKWYEFTTGDFKRNRSLRLSLSIGDRKCRSLWLRLSIGDREYRSLWLRLSIVD